MIVETAAAERLARKALIVAEIKARLTGSALRLTTDKVCSASPASRCVRTLDALAIQLVVVSGSTCDASGIRDTGKAARLTLLALAGNLRQE